jgi:hypothetical protein
MHAVGGCMQSFRVYLTLEVYDEQPYLIFFFIIIQYVYLFVVLYL